MREDTKQIRKWNYGNYSSSNHGSSIAVQIGKLTLYYSYNSVVAFEDASQEGEDFQISKNMWSTTTGRHLNCLSRNKKKRLPRNEFVDKLNKTLDKYGLSVNDKNRAVVKS